MIRMMTKRARAVVSVAAVLCGAAALNAQAAGDSYNVISADWKGNFGFSLGKSDPEAAIKEAYGRCHATRCHPVLRTHNPCLAIATAHAGKQIAWGVSSATDKSTAAGNALQQCNLQGIAGCALREAACQ